MRYQVLVGNIGMVHETNNVRDARFNARQYVEQSKSGRGRAAGESVTVFDTQENEIVDEYVGTLHRNDEDGLSHMEDNFGGEEP